MSIDRAQVESVARLAQLTIDEQEMAQTMANLNDILALVDQMQAQDTTGVEPLANPLDATARLRADEVTYFDEQAEKRAELQANAPKAEQGLFLVPRVIE